MLKNSIIIGVLIVCLTGLLVGGYLLQSNILEKEDIIKSLDKLDLKEIDKIMIVAHPDDEMLWGGNHLIEDKYLVVCVTCGDNKERKIEFEKVMEEIDCPHLSLYYPDRNTWQFYRKDIIKDLKLILKYKKYEEIVTHNPDGEYGHDQHKMVSEFTTSIAPKNKLYYFNHYYTNEELKTLKTDYELNDIDSVRKVEKILENYKSQKEIINNHKAMIPYEHFIPYDEWN